MRHRALDEVSCSVARARAVLGARWTILLSPMGWGDPRAGYAPGAW